MTGSPKKKTDPFDVPIAFFQDGVLVNPTATEADIEHMIGTYLEVFPKTCEEAFRFMVENTWTPGKRMAIYAQT